VLDVDPGNATVLNNKGCSLRDLGRFDEALRVFDRGLAIDPGDHILAANRIHVLELLRRAGTDEEHDATGTTGGTHCGHDA
jgi:Flp pilus assembly protein TadD